METLRTIVLVLAISLIIVSGFCYLKARKKLKTNKDIIKTELEKYIKIYSIILVVAIILGITAIILNIIFDKNVATTITLDINPSIELKLDSDNRVMGINPLNDDAIWLTPNTRGKIFDEALGLIVEKLLEKETVHPGEEINVILYATGKMKTSEIKSKLVSSFNAREVRSNIIVIEKVTEEDEKFAKKNKMGVGKAAYISEIARENENINPDVLVDKSVNEIKETKERGVYCEIGYKLEGDFCLKKVSSENPIAGKVCDEGYYLYNGACYEEVSNIETNEYECPGDRKLNGTECSFVEHIEAAANFKCEAGELIKREMASYKKYRDSGNPDEYVCEDRSNAKAPTLRCLLNSGHKIINGNCYNGPAPLINGGCPNGDIPVNGWCYSKDDGDQWQCPDGSIYEKSKGTYTELCPDTFKYTKATGNYSCPEGYTLNKNECTITKYEAANKKMVCPTGYTKLENGRCINKNNSKPMIDGNVCEKENARLENNKCIIYDIIEANR